MHPLSQQVRLVGQQARRLLLWRGLVWWLLSLLVAAFLWGVSDYWFRFDEAVLRWFGLIGVLSVGLAVWIRLVLPALFLRCGDEVVAHWVERRFPELRDRLTSAMAFLRQSSSDLRFGSPSLRQLVIDDAAAAVAHRNLGECLDRRAVWRAAVVLSLTALSVLAVCALDRRSAIVAGRRLLMPWRQEAWPRRHWLVMTNVPEKLASGQDFLAQVVDSSGWLPSEVTLLYWFDGDDESQVRRQRMLYAGGKMTHRLPQVTRSFRYRAVGGDDQEMPWRRLEVITPPRLLSTTARLTPPAYTGLPATDAREHLRGMAGTTVELTGKVDKPLASVQLRMNLGKQAHSFPAAISEDGLSFHVPADQAHPCRLTESGSYSWIFTDREGVTCPAEGKWALDVLADLAPTIAVESPKSADSFTKEAKIPIRLLVKDDLAVKTVTMQVGDEPITLFEREEPPAMELGDAWPPRGEQRVLEHDLAVAEIAGAASGSVLTLKFVATDFKPQESRSAEVNIAIITGEELLGRIDQRQTALLQRLQECLRLQRTLRSQTVKTREEILAAAGALRESGLLPGIELGQRRVRDLLEGEDGALQRVSALLDELANNRVADEQLHMHLSQVAEELWSIANELLPPVEQQLGRAEKLLRVVQPPSSGEPQDQDMEARGDQILDLAIAGQDQVIYSLEELVDRLSQWSGYRLLAQEVADIRAEQLTLLAETRNTSTASRDLLQLTDEENAELRRLSLQQGDLATRMDRLQQRLQRMRQRFGDTSPLAVAAMDEALGVIQEHTINARMREAGRQLGGNQIGSATTVQEEILNSLQLLIDALSQRPETDLERIAESLRQASEAVEALRQRQVSVAQAAEEAKNLPPDARRQALQAVADEERVLAEAIQELARQLRRLAPDTVVQELEAVEKVMRAAERSASQEDAAGAAEQAAAAAQQLRQLSDQLAEQAARASQQQAAMEDRYLRNSVEALLRAQAALLTDTRQLALQLTTEGQLPEPAQPSALNLSTKQEELATGATEVARRVDDRPAFALSLDRVAQSMSRAAQGLGELKPGSETTDAQLAAMARLQQLVDALAEGGQPPSEPPASPDEAPDEKPVDEPPPVAIAEIKILHAWQLEINRRTETITQGQIDKGELSESQKSELAELAADQQRLVAIVEKITEKMAGITAGKADRKTVRKQDGAGTPEVRPPQASNTESLDEALRKSGIPGFDNKEP